jgi:hypothetical protein
MFEWGLIQVFEVKALKTFVVHNCVAEQDMFS